MTCILVVDDEKLIRTTLSKMLQEAGYKVFEATNGNEALRVFGEHTPDLVITDIIMPEKDGIETITELRNRQPDVKILAVSGGGWSGGIDYLGLAKKLGASDVLAKPFRTEQVLSAVNKVLDRAD